MDENHNKIDEVQCKTSDHGNKSQDNNQGYAIPNTQSTLQPHFHSNFEKLKDLQKGLLFTRDIMSPRIQESLNNPSTTCGGGDASELNGESDEALLYLFVNRMFGPVEEHSGTGIKFQELVAILDKKEREKQVNQLTLTEELNKYKELYDSIVVEYEGFKKAMRNSISTCQIEMGVTVDSLYFAHQHSLDELERQKQDSDETLRRANREILNLTCQIRSLNGEVAQFQNQLDEKSSEAEEYHLDAMRLKERCESLSQAHTILFEQLNAAEQRNEMYKTQLAEVQEHNTRLMDSLGKSFEDHANEVRRLKEHMDTAENEATHQRDAFALTITELSDACQRQVEYTKEVLTYSKQREAEYEEGKSVLESYIQKAVKQCSSTLTHMEEIFKGAQQEKELLRKEITELVEKLKSNDVEYETKIKKSIAGIKNVNDLGEMGEGDANKLSSAELQAFLEKSYAKGTELGLGYWKNELGSDNDRHLSRIRQLEKLNEDHMEKIQRSNAKYRKLYDKYMRYKELSEKQGKKIVQLQKYIQSQEKERQPITNDQIYKLEKQIDEARLKHAQFGALLHGIQTEDTNSIK